MKIAYVYDAVYPYQIGGVEKRIFEISKRLASKGHDVHIFGLKTWDGNSSFRRHGIWYHGIGQTRSLYHKGRRSVSEAVYFGCTVLNPLLREHFDIIDCQNFPYFSCFSSVIASRINHIPLVITWHEVWGDYWYEYLGKQGFFGKMIEKYTAGLSDNLIAVSELTRSDLVGLNPRAHITLISNGVDIRQIDATQTLEDISDIIFIGRLIREKRPDLLIRALILIKKEIPDIKCLIVGNGPEKEELIRQCRKYHLEKNIRFMGFLQDHNELISLMKGSKVFASPSVREGFGMAAAEALACGLPVVTCNAPENAVKDLIDVKTGIISNMTDEAFADAILEAFRRRESMTLDCKTIARRFDWEIIVQEIEEYYGSVALYSSR